MTVAAQKVGCAKRRRLPPTVEARWSDWVSKYRHLFDDMPNWPAADDGRGFLERVKAMPDLDRAYEDFAKLQVQLWLSAAPALLSAAEKDRAAKLIERMVAEYPGSSPAQLLWAFAADATQPRRRGRASRWTGVEGRELMELVDAGLEATGETRDKRKGLRRVIAMIRAAAPARYGQLSEERLRKAYYDARRAQSGN